MMIRICKNCRKFYLTIGESPGKILRLCYHCSWGGNWGYIDKEPYLVWQGTKKELLEHLKK